MTLAATVQKFQHLDVVVPRRWRLPLRFHVQTALGALEPEMQLLPRLLGPSKRPVALDIGANVGIYTYALWRHGAHVHVFEPQPDCASTIAAWSAATGADITLHSAAAGSKAGTLTLFVPLHRGIPIRTRASFEPPEDAASTIQVPVVALDDLGLNAADLIKIDVEGFELQVLRGAVDLLKNVRPRLLVEIDRSRQSKSRFDETIGLLSNLGYHSHILSQGRLTPCQDPWHAPATIYNFVFLP